MMKASSLGLDKKEVGSEKTQPRLIMWTRGLPVTCSDLEELHRAATVYAGEHPGTVVGLYELIGTAYVPPTYPEVEPVERATDALMIAPPEAGNDA
jgi:hypothetical protein